MIAILKITKWYKYFWATSLLLLFCSSLLSSQDFIFQHVTNANGLTENEYNWYINKDSRGLIWISSDDGLYRYDGLDIRLFQTGSDKDNDLNDDRIQSDFFEDNNGDIWFSTYGAINCLRRAKNAFETFQVDYDSVTITEGYRAFHLERNSGKLWLQADTLLFWFQINSNPNRPEYDCISDSLTQGINFVVDTLPSGEVYQIYAFLWAAPGVEIFTFQNNATWKVERLLQEYIPNHSVSVLKINDGIIQNDSFLCLFSDQGLFLFDRINNKIIGSHSPGNEPSLMFYKGIFLDERNLLIVSKSKGLWLFDTIDSIWRQIDQNQTSLLSNNIDALHLDKQNRLWLSQTSKGVGHSQVTRSGQQFRNPMQVYIDTLPKVKFILENDGVILVASEEHGINVFSRNERKINDNSFESSKSESLQIGVVMDLSQDKNGVVWCLSDTAIYFFYNDQWQLAFHSSQYRFLQLFHINRSRQLVITTDGVYNLLNNDGHYSLKKCPEPVFKKKVELSFRRFFEGINGQILIPYQDKELWIGKLDKNNNIEIVDTIPFLARISCISKNEKTGTTWLGTSEGLAKLDSNNILHPLLHEVDQIGTSKVFGVLESNNGTLFLSTKKGLYAYNPNSNEKILLRYGIEDGLSSEDFTEYAALKASDGKLWFGNSKGLTVFHPDSIGPYPYAPNPYILDLLVNNVPYQGDTVIGESKRIALSHRDNSLAFQMKAIGYHFPALNTLQYRMLGYDEDWVTIKNGESARFTKIPPREKAYYLEYKAVNVNGVESPSKFLEIYIAPPLYKRLWFQILVFILLVSLIYAYYRYRIAQIKKEARYKQMIAETETAVLRLQMNPHFIFNSMNSISSYILQKDIHTANDYLGRFARLMRMILDFAAKPLIEVADEVELLTLYLQAETMRFEGRFDFAIEYGEGFDPDEYLIPPMILQPFVENAILHAFTGKKEKGQIAIRFWQEEHSLFCSVEDNGIGRGAAAQQNNKAKTHESKALGITARRMELLEHKNGIVPNIQFTDLVDENNVAMGTRVLLRFPVL